MKKLLFIFAFMCASLAFAQKTKAEQKLLADFQEAFNTENYQAIYNLYSNDKKQELPLGRVKMFFRRMYRSKGKILDLNFYGKRRAFNVYEAVHEKTLGAVVVRLDNKGKATVLSTRSNAQKAKK